MSENQILPNAGQLCAIGVITKVFGIKGEVKLHSYARSAEEIKAIDEIYCGRQTGSMRRIVLEDVRMRGSDVYLKVENINDRSAAETLIGHFLFIDEKERKRLPEGRYFIDDLIGLEVRHENGTLLGRIKDVLTSTPQALLVLKTPRGEVLVPNVPAIVKSVDPNARVMTLTPPDGLFGGDET
ncbi:MAG: ribosome maturation factor RimM [Ignavibacteriales bacterium]|nr:ribosome maturation factor RimM [Ignavibacteriales bacterium]